MNDITRRRFLSHVTVGTAALSWGAAVSMRTPSVGANLSSQASGDAGLQPLAFECLPLTSIHPTGWLERQLRIQAQGLSGHLDEFWPDVRDSQWFGGKADGWERAPYWLDGAVPLAWLVQDEALKSRIQKHIETIIANQRSDGWYGPFIPPQAQSGARQSYDVWAIMLANKVLVQYHAITGDDRALDAVACCLKAMNEHLDQYPLFNWGKFRWFENLVAIYYVFEKTHEPWLLDLARKHHEQGFDYRSFYRGFDATVPTPRRGRWKWDKHVVNNAMAVKAYPLWGRVSRALEDREAVYEIIRLLDHFHGQATGMFTGDECLSGKNPIQGSELCAVVEYMYSLEHCLAITGDPYLADRLEQLAFNALPATFSPDMWAHQYDQQTNQAQCTVNPEHLWSTNGPDSNLYGLEPNFGCCTANMHQGWPKFAAHLWMRTAEGGLVAAAYAPSRVEIEVEGVPVEVDLQTDYPFRDTLTLRVKAAKPVTFPLLLRIPGWTTGAEVTVDGVAIAPPAANSYERIQRQWEGETTVQVRLPMPVKTSRRFNDAISLERGPLVYSLKIEEKWTRVNADKPHRELPHADWEVHPASDWNYALLIDEDAPEKSVQFTEKPVGDVPFSPAGAPVEAVVQGRRLPSWKLRQGWADETPVSPVSSGEPLQGLTLIPYGCTNIRITEFPRLQQ